LQHSEKASALPDADDAAAKYQEGRPPRTPENSETEKEGEGETSAATADLAVDELAGDPQL
jgi:hypothetical protein